MSLDQLYNNVSVSVDAMSDAFLELEISIMEKKARSELSHFVIATSKAQQPVFQRWLFWFADVYGEELTPLRTSPWVTYEELEKGRKLSEHRVILPLFFDEKTGFSSISMNNLIHKVVDASPSPISIMLLYISWYIEFSHLVALTHWSQLADESRKITLFTSLVLDDDQTATEYKTTPQTEKNKQENLNEIRMLKRWLKRF